MINFFQKIIAKIINSKLVIQNPYVNLNFIELRLSDLKVLKCLEQVTMGEKSRFYGQAEVSNLQNNKARIIVGKNTHIRGGLLIFAHNGSITIGDNCYVGLGTQIWSANNVTIGNDVLIAHNCNIIDTNSHEEKHWERAQSYVKMLDYGHPTKNVNVRSDQIIIEDHVWISFNVSILKGVKIGKGAIICAGSVVLRDVDSFTMVAGNPAVFKRNISQE